MSKTTNKFAPEVRPVESAQYLSIRYTERLGEAGTELSVGSVGDSYDNALEMGRLVQLPAASGANW